MMRVGLVALLVFALNGADARAQYARPVEAAPQVRPIAPAPSVVVPSPNAAPIAPAPTVNAPAAIVPSPPPAAVQGASARPRKCWCYLVNPVTNFRQRSTCEIGCCKGGDQDERC
jgi:hypothetical protein